MTSTTAGAHVEIETCEATGDPIEFCACDDDQEARATADYDREEAYATERA